MYKHNKFPEALINFSTAVTYKLYINQLANLIIE